MVIRDLKTNLRSNFQIENIIRCMSSPLQNNHRVLVITILQLGISLAVFMHSYILDFLQPVHRVLNLVDSGSKCPKLTESALLPEVQKWPTILR